MIENLPLLRPEASRHAKTVARCHERLAARRRKIEGRERSAKSGAVAAERLLATGVCVLYLIAMAGDLIWIAAQR
jgi:hypothetical protein